MAISLFIFVARPDEPLGATVLMTILVGIGVTAVILWNRRYRRVWEQYRGGRWPKAVGRFSSGEVITMLTARTQQPAGYEVWMEYEYKAGQQMEGLYKRPVSTREAGEAYIKRLVNQSIPVRVAPRRPSTSCVLDHDVDALINGGIGAGHRP
jgi:hypothetical protein